MITFRTISGKFPAWKRAILPAAGVVCLLCATIGCSSLGKSAATPNPAPSAPGSMLVAVANTPFQPLQALQTPRYQGLQTSVTSARRQSRTTATRRQLAQFTPVKVLKTNKSYALVELQGGERGFLPVNNLSTEAALNAAIPAALPVDPTAPYIDPVTGLLINPGASPEMITTDPLVDQAMLNGVDSIRLPESETEFQEMNPEAQVVDDVLLRKPAPKATPPATTVADQ